MVHPAEKAMYDGVSGHQTITLPTLDSMSLRLFCVRQQLDLPADNN